MKAALIKKKRYIERAETPPRYMLAIPIARAAASPEAVSCLRMYAAAPMAPMDVSVITILQTGARAKKYLSIKPNTAVLLKVR